MKILSVLMACSVGLFAAAQAAALVSVFDYYFYFLPFGLALVGLFLAAGIARRTGASCVNTGNCRALPVMAVLALLLCVALYKFATSLGAPVFFWALVAMQLLAYALLASAVMRDGPSLLLAAGTLIGLALGHGLTAYWNMDPLIVTLGAVIIVGGVCFAQYLRQWHGFAFILITCLAALAINQAREINFMPSTLGWELDRGKAVPAGVGGSVAAKRLWGPAGATDLIGLGEDARASLLYTNASSPALVLTGEPESYGNDWWVQSAPLTVAIHDAVMPESIMDIGIAPSEMVWRAIGQGKRTVFGKYGSLDWLRLQGEGLAALSKVVVAPPTSTFSESDGLKSAVDMVVLSSGHLGNEGWVSSNQGEQNFLDKHNIQSYWKALDEDGVLVLFSSQESVFLRQFFSIWAALNHAGMTDSEFLDRAWAVVPERVSSASPHRYAIVISKKARNEALAQAIRKQVLTLPVRYLFGYGLPPSPPYSVLYQNDRARAESIFSLAASRMYGKQVALGAEGSFNSTPYQFVLDAYPSYKHMLVLSVAALLAIILFPLRSHRSVEAIQVRQEPGVAVWMVAGAATGVVVVIGLAFLLAFPSSITQEARLSCLLILLPMVFLLQIDGGGVGKWGLLSLAFASALLLAFCVALLLALVPAESGEFLVGIAGLLAAVLGLSLLVMQSSQIEGAERGAELIAWWWFAMAAGAAATLFWSTRLYMVLGEGLLLLAAVLLIFIAGVLWWGGWAQQKQNLQADMIRAMQH